MAMFGTSWRLGRIAGVEVRVDSSWAVIALLITYCMYLRISFLYPQLSGGGAVGLAVVSAVLFFGSVLVHELAHALASQARGIRVQDITLFLFGGATRARVESRGPGDEFLIALVGPLTSALLAGLFGIVAGLGHDVLPRPLAGRWAGCWWPPGWPPCWPGTSPAASGSRSSAGSWSRPPAPPTRSSSCGTCCAEWR